jgi:glycosyltransferase involved in cell wall biosynthesis
MRFLFLCEGDAESWDSWSGISKSLVDYIRAAGHEVIVANVDVSGADRWLAAGATFAPVRRRWATRYHLGAAPFWLRSRRARHHIMAHRGRIDAIVQIGSTFEPRGRGDIPYFVCSDSNIRVAQQGASSGFSDATPLTHAELDGIARREGRVYHGASALFPLSERLRRSFIDDFGIAAVRVKAIYAGPNFDVARVPDTPAPNAQAHPPTVLFVGRQYHRKGGDVLVESFRQVRSWLPDARLMIAGLPPGHLDVAGVTCLGDLDKGTDAGWRALSDAYASANVFALPTRFEPFGIAFVEAMHFGLPCIGPEAWAVPEIIANGETGFTVPVDDVERLTDRLLQLLTQTDLARRMGEAGRARARAMFTWPRVVRRMLDVMTPLVDARGHAGIADPLASAALPQ